MKPIIDRDEGVAVFAFLPSDLVRSEYAAADDALLEWWLEAEVPSDMFEAYAAKLCFYILSAHPVSHEIPTKADNSPDYVTAIGGWSHWLAGKAEVISLMTRVEREFGWVSEECR